MTIIKKISLVLMIVLYISAGINHFIRPDSYYPIIPAYFPFPALINIISGSLELLLGIGLMLANTRKIACYGIIILLILFIPAHVYMIQKGGCMSETMCLPAWAAWIRLFPLQFLLMWWAWWHSK